MKKLLVILGLMMMLVMSMASAIVVDDFNQPDGAITTSSQNNLGDNYYGAGALASSCSYLNNEVYCGASSGIYSNDGFPSISLGDNITFTASCDGAGANNCYIQIGDSVYTNFIQVRFDGIDNDIWLDSQQLELDFVWGEKYDFRFEFVEIVGPAGPPQYYSYNFDIYLNEVFILNKPFSVETNNAYQPTTYSFWTTTDGILTLDNFEVGPCSPNWTCNNWVCVEPDEFESCDSVIDTNTCGGSYTGDYSEFVGNACVYNTAPVINSITPNTRIELTQGDSQLYTSDVTDDEMDAVYSWTLGSTEVSTGTTYTANWEDIEPGIYTLTLEVSDAEYSDTASTTLEIRAVGGSSSLSIITPEVVEEEQEYEVTADQATPQTSAFSKFTGNVGDFFSSIGNWFGGLFR